MRLKRLWIAFLATAVVLSASSLAVFAATGDVKINSTNFPDKGFRDYLIDYEKTTAGFDGDGVFSKDEIKLIKEIRPDSSVKSVVGIGKLTSVENLYLGACTELTSVDLSKNTALIRFSAAGTKLESISFKNNPNLISINLRNTQISSVDVTMCPNLRNLNISGNGNRIVSVDISKNPSLFDIVSTGTFTSSNHMFEYAKSIGGSKCVLKYDDKTEIKAVLIDYVNFPDPAFNLLVNRIDRNSDSYFSISEIESVNSLGTRNRSLKSLKGIEFFYKLKYVDFANCAISEADVSKNKALVELDLYDNQLSSIDVSTLESLEILNVGLNKQLNSVDVSNNTKLEKLRCQSLPKLTSIDVSNNKDLTLLNVSNCALTSLDLSNNPKLLSLSCATNKLTSLDINHLTSLQSLFCGGNAFQSIDVSNFTDLRALSVYQLNLKSLDLSNNTLLTELGCYKNSLTTLDLTNNKYLQILNCDDNKLSELKIHSNALTEVACNNNRLSSLNFEGCEKLKKIHCDNNLLNKINVSDCIKLEVLDCEKNKLSSLDLSSCQIISSIDCAKNELTSLVIDSDQITFIDCSDNKLTSLNLSKCKLLNNFYCTNNQLESIDLSNCSNISRVFCENNSISKLDVSDKAKLRALACYGNQITKIDISNTSLSKATLYEKNRTDLLALPDKLKYEGLIYAFTKDKGGSLCYDNYLLIVDREVEIDGLESPYIPAAENEPTPPPFLQEDPTPTPSPIPTVTPTATVSPTVTVMPTVTPTGTVTPGAKPTSTVAPTSTVEPGAKPTATVAPTGTVTPSVKPTSTVTPNTTVNPSSTISPTPGLTPDISTNESDEPSDVVEAKTVGDFVERLYTKCLNRDFDPAGKEYWIDQLKSGESGAEVAMQFFCSPEFEGFGLDDKEYVTRLYRTFMDREPDNDGMKYWLDELASGKSREYVFFGFVNSPEWANICLEYGIISGGTGVPTITKEPSKETIEFAKRLYTTCMCREADAEGVDYWANELSNMRRTGTQVASDFFFSPEFIGLKVSDDEYINRLYKTFMGREADAAGFDYWKDELVSSDRETILQRFAGCQEFAFICFEAGIIR